jgi:hypothetical protein
MKALDSHCYPQLRYSILHKQLLERASPTVVARVAVTSTSKITGSVADDGFLADVAADST